MEKQCSSLSVLICDACFCSVFSVIYFSVTSVLPHPAKMQTAVMHITVSNTCLSLLITLISFFYFCSSTGGTISAYFLSSSGVLV